MHSYVDLRRLSIFLTSKIQSRVFFKQFFLFFNSPRFFPCRLPKSSYNQEKNKNCAFSLINADSSLLTSTAIFLVKS